MQDRREQRRLRDLERLGDVRASPAPPEAITGTETASATARGDLEVVALARPVGVDRGEQDLPRSALLGLDRPLDRAAGRVGRPGAGADAAALGVDRDDDRLRAEPLGERGDQRRACERRGVDGDLVGAGGEERVGIGDRADPAADRERDRELLGDAPDDADERVALLERRLHVEEDELVGAAIGVRGAELDRVADVAQLLELDALDDAAGGDVEARDQARERNRSLTSVSTRSR